MHYPLLLPAITTNYPWAQIMNNSCWKHPATPFSNFHEERFLMCGIDFYWWVQHFCLCREKNFQKFDDWTKFLNSTKSFNTNFQIYFVVGSLVQCATFWASRLGQWGFWVSIAFSHWVFALSAWVWPHYFVRLWAIVFTGYLLFELSLGTDLLLLLLTQAILILCTCWTVLFHILCSRCVSWV